MQSVNQQELEQVGLILQQILQNDNQTRKEAEGKLNTAKSQSADQYAVTLCAVIHPSTTQFALDVKSLAAVIIRRNISIQEVDSQDVSNASNNSNLWQRLSDNGRQAVQAMVIETLNQDNCQSKQFTHKVCNLSVEIQGAMNEHQDNNIW